MTSDYFQVVGYPNGGQTKEKPILEILVEVAGAAARMMATGNRATVGE